MELLTKEEIIKSAFEKEIRYDNEWGFGQMKIDYIIKQGYNTDQFYFVKTVSAADDDWQERTITADKDSLFVFPIDKRL